MSITLFWIYIAMYIYGFGLTIWALFFDKTPTDKSRKAAKWGLIGLILTLFYFIFVIWAFGIQ